MEPQKLDAVVVITAVGRDQPGIIAAIAKAIFELGGNLDDATMTRLHGAFSTMVAARLPLGRSERDVRVALAPVAAALGLTLAVQAVPDALPEDAPDTQITVYGADRPGIVYRVTSRLAARGVNITDMDTRLTGTAAAPVYVMLLEAVAGETDLTEDLAALREELGVNISAQPLDTEAL